MKKANKDKNEKPLVFISWGGSLLEQAKAEALQSFIESKLPVSIFVSSRDIATCSIGWRSVIYKNLNKAKYGIVIISKENTNRPWIMYESGAMSMHLRFRNISLLSFDSISLERNHPLEDKNMCFFNSNGIGRLLNDIGNSLKLATTLYNPNTDYIELQDLIKSRKKQLEKYEQELINSKDKIESNIEDIPENIKESVVAEVTGKLSMPDGSSPYTGEVEIIEINNERITRPKTKKGACCINKSGNIIKPLTQAEINRMTPALQSNISDTFKVVEIMGIKHPTFNIETGIFKNLKAIEKTLIIPESVANIFASEQVKLLMEAAKVGKFLKTPALVKQNKSIYTSINPEATKACKVLTKLGETFEAPELATVIAKQNKNLDIRINPISPGKKSKNTTARRPPKSRGNNLETSV